MYSNPRNTGFLQLFDNKFCTFHLDALSYCQWSIQLGIYPTTNSITVFRIKFQLKEAVNISKQHFAIYGIGLITAFFNFRTLFIKLILNFTYNLFENIFNCYHTGSTAVFINKYSQLAAMFLQHTQKLADRQRFRHNQHISG